MSYALEYPLAIHAAQSERAAFIRRTYAHLAGAILAFTAIEFAIFNVLSAEQLGNFVSRFFASPVSLIVLLVAFMGFGYLARWWAYQGTSPAVQYAGLALYVVLEAVIFLPILAYVVYGPLGQAPQILGQAAVLTLSVFGGLTMAVFTTRKDFSFLGPILCIASFLMLGAVIAGALIGFNMGLVYSFLGVALASGFILYDTSNVLHHFRTDAHVAAALELFASVAYLFYHILRILILLASERR